VNLDYIHVQLAASGTRSPRRTSHEWQSGGSPYKWARHLEKEFSGTRVVFHPATKRALLLFSGVKIRRKMRYLYDDKCFNDNNWIRLKEEKLRTVPSRKLHGANTNECSLLQPVQVPATCRLHCATKCDRLRFAGLSTRNWQPGIRRIVDFLNIGRFGPPPNRTSFVPPSLGDSFIPRKLVSIVAFE